LNERLHGQPPAPARRDEHRPVAVVRRAVVVARAAVVVFSSQRGVSSKSGCCHASAATSPSVALKPMSSGCASCGQRRPSPARRSSSRPARVRFVPPAGAPSTRLRARTRADPGLEVLTATAFSFRSRRRHGAGVWRRQPPAPRAWRPATLRALRSPRRARPRRPRSARTAITFVVRVFIVVLSIGSIGKGLAERVVGALLQVAQAQRRAVVDVYGSPSKTRRDGPHAGAFASARRPLVLPRWTLSTSYRAGQRSARHVYCSALSLQPGHSPRGRMWPCSSW
jgi:hypothetical protein